MTTANEQHRETDHKSWLNDIERWRYDLRVWDNHREAFQKDAQAAVAAVDAFIESAKEHTEAIAQFQKQILDCERGVLEHKYSEEEMERRHAAASTEHSRRGDRHTQLEEQRHKLMTALKSFL